MTSDYLDYENNLAFAPKSADDLNKQGRTNDVIVTALEECEKLKQQLHTVLEVLLKVSPQHEGYVRANFPEFYKEQANVWFE